MSTGTEPPQVVMREVLEAYQASRAKGADAGGAFFHLWERFTAPYRVLPVAEHRGERHPHFVILRIEGHGDESEVWHLRGAHRELDALRLSVMLCNETRRARQEALAKHGLGEWPD